MCIFLGQTLSDVINIDYAVTFTLMPPEEMVLHKLIFLNLSLHYMTQHLKYKICSNSIVHHKP